MSDDTPEVLMELEEELWRERAIKIAQDVMELPIGGIDKVNPSQWEAGYLQACEEILHRLKNESWVLKQ